MKRLFILMVIVASSLVMRAEAAAGSVPNGPAADAARQEADERYKRMAADIVTLSESNQALQERINRLTDEINRLREDLARTSSEAAAANTAAKAAANNQGVREDMKTLANKIVEVDKKRESDKQAIAEEVRRSNSRLEEAINKLAAIAAQPPPVRSTRSRGDDQTSSSKGKDSDKDAVSLPEKGVLYVVQPNDSLGSIVREANKQFKEKGLKTITTAQMRAANPKINWDRLRSGQKIKIPLPSKN